MPYYKKNTKKASQPMLSDNIDRMFGQTRVQNKVMSVPKVSTEGSTICIKQSEYFSDLYGSSNFVSNAWDINAGLGNLFPQLSVIASLFEQYAFTELTFEYRPMIFDQISGSNNDMGTVSITVDYDVTRGLFVNKLQAENYEFTTSVKPSDPIIYNANVTKNSNNVFRKYYVRGQALNGQDQRLYDLGNLQVCVQGQLSNGSMGELWVHYVCHFWKQHILSPVVSLQEPWGRIEVQGTFNPSNWFGASQPTVTNYYGPLGSSIYVNPANTNQVVFDLDFPSGNYYTMFRWYGSSVTAITPPTLLGDGVTVQTTIPTAFLRANTGTTGLLSSGPTVDATDTTITELWTVNANQVFEGTIQSSGGTASGSLTNFSLLVWTLPQAFNETVTPPDT